MLHFLKRKHPVRIGIDSTGTFLTIVVRFKQMGKTKFSFFSCDVSMHQENLSHVSDSVEDFLQQFDLTNAGVTIGLPFFKSMLGFLEIPKVLKGKKLSAYINEQISVQTNDDLENYTYDYAVLRKVFLDNKLLKMVVFCASKKEILTQQLAYYSSLRLNIDAVEHLAIALMRGNDFFIQTKKSTKQLLLEITENRLSMLIREGERVYWMQSTDETNINCSDEIILEIINTWFNQYLTDMPDMKIKQIIIWGYKRYHFDFFEQLKDVQVLLGDMSKISEDCNDYRFLSAFGLSLWQLPHVVD